MVRAGNADPTIFLIDFGLARQFRDPATYLHTSFTTRHFIVGTLPFMSVNGQLGYAQSRRDDLESLAYTIIYLACGDLPWGTHPACKDHNTVLEKKKLITVEELCKGLPPLFSEFIAHIRSLSFNKKPDYDHLHTILLQCSAAETDQKSKALPAPPSLGANGTPSLSIISDRV
jgi:casein kinase 1